MKKTTVNKPKSPKSKTTMRKLRLKTSKGKNLEDLNFSEKLANCSLKDTNNSGAAGDFAYGSNLEIPEIKSLDLKIKNSRKVQASSTEVSEDKVKDFSTNTNSLGFSSADDINKIPTFSVASSGSEWKAWTPSKIKIDFKPTEEDEKLYEKCTKLWKYLHSIKELEKMVEVPQKVQKGSSKKDIPFSYDDVEILNEEQNEQNDMFNFPATMMIASLDPALLELTITEKVNCNEIDENYDGNLKKSEDTKQICKEMDEFDKTHAKSFSPPRLLPPLKIDISGSPIAN